MSETVSVRTLCNLARLQGLDVRRRSSFFYQ